MNTYDYFSDNPGGRVFAGHIPITCEQAVRLAPIEEKVAIFTTWSFSFLPDDFFVSKAYWQNAFNLADFWGHIPASLSQIQRIVKSRAGGYRFWLMLRGWENTVILIPVQPLKLND